MNVVTGGFTKRYTNEKKIEDAKKAMTIHLIPISIFRKNDCFLLFFLIEQKLNNLSYNQFIDPVAVHINDFKIFSTY